MHSLHLTTNACIPRVGWIQLVVRRKGNVLNYLQAQPAKRTSAMGTLHVVAAPALQNRTGASRTRLTFLANNSLGLALFFRIRPLVSGTVDSGQMSVSVGEAVLVPALLTHDLRWLWLANLSVLAFGARPVISIHLVELEAPILRLGSLINQCKDISFGKWDTTQTPILLIVKARRINLPISNRRNKIIGQALATKSVMAS